MKEIKVTVNTWYVVEGAAGATVINPLTNRAIATVEDGKQASFLATTPYVVASDDSVNVFKAPFNSAPAKLKLLGLLGGGSSTGLPAGYLAAEFLESTGAQYIMTGFFPDDSSVIELDVKPVAAPNNMSIWLFANADAGRTESGRAFKAASDRGSLYFEFGDFKSANSSNPTAPGFGIRRKMMLKNGLCDTGLDTRTFHKQIFKDRLVELSLFRNIRDATVTTLDIYSCCLTKNGKAERYFVPALDAAGTPCMLDTVSKLPFRNAGSGQFVAGFTLAQARKLGKLPSGTTLTVSLPVGYVSDAGVVDALAEAEANGCVLTIQTYESTSAVSTFALRRVWVRKVQDEYGSYVAADGSRWQVDWCVDIVGADPEQEGYEPFRSVEAACEYWELTQYVDPAWEEELLTETENNEQE